MNLKEQLEGYMRNKTLLLIKVAGATKPFGRIEKVEDDYIVFRSVIIRTEESWWSDDIKYKYCGTTTWTIPFAILECAVHPNMEWAKKNSRKR